jgi:hypothetical protein
MRTFRGCLPIVVLALAAPAAQAAEGLDALLRACRAETDDARRLACYDRIAGPAQAAPAPVSPGTGSVPPAAASSASAASAPPSGEAAAAGAAEDFGLEQAQANEEAKRQQEKARALAELEASVTGIDARMDGLLTITLDNGQVWRQNRPDSRFRLKVGDRIRIQPGSLNSFILSGPTNKSTRVTRVE